MNTCKTCNKSFTKKQMEDHLASNSHISLQFRSASEYSIHQTESTQHQIKIIERKTDHPLFKIKPDNLIEEVDLELKKIAYYLYYSSAFPYEVSLEYLKCYHKKISSKNNWGHIEVGILISSLLRIFREDLKNLKSDEGANRTRIELLTKIVAFTVLIRKMCYNAKEEDWIRENLLKAVTTWNKHLDEVIQENGLV
ncbi:uncharacterized protein LOC115884428 isoform X2 [Sitophilus oryzae]|uniref:Uncharacterized protein LOC115884428 isoform X2 n=1 Tax=Sitophilus oryzae TaxID=7048 RepID=A0A6J2Y7A4_SITOR|nr:uncharacterized protein LOC115884428 isoform X2 [Sitophilus oryzae]